MPSLLSGIRALPLILALTASGCSLSYDDLTITEDIPESIPDSVMRDFTHTTVRESLPVFSLNAGEALTYSKKKRIYLTKITFAEYDSEGEIATSGRARNAVFHTDTEDAEISGDVLFYSTRQEASVEAESLYWNSEERLLTGNPNEEVRIIRDSGAEIRGRGFRGDLKTLTFTFEDSVSGTYLDEED